VTNSTAQRNVREEVFMRDENLRSSMNSQSQMSESSFPTPIDPPPRIPHPPLNPDELVAAYYPHTRATSLPNFAGPLPQVPLRKNVDERDSNIQPFSGPAFAAHSPRLVEVGESSRQGENTQNVHTVEKGDSSKRKNMGGPRFKDDARKSNEDEHMNGGILKPPKKR
jgi:hypothetical protein